jgi:hypothetical protein
MLRPISTTQKTCDVQGEDEFLTYSNEVFIKDVSLCSPTITFEPEQAAVFGSSSHTCDCATDTL